MADFDSNLDTQGTDAFDANTHSMIGRKPNGNLQNCEQAVAGLLVLPKELKKA